MVPVVEDLIIEGKVNYRSFTHFHFPFPHIKEDDPTRFVGAQLYVNQDCLQTFGHRHDWLGFIVRLLNLLLMILLKASLRKDHARIPYKNIINSS